MYGSIHNHFESRFDTANNMKKMLENYVSLGAKKIVATEHGVFSSYEDLKDTLKKLNAPDTEIIPGIEAYLEMPEQNSKKLKTAHLILFAKDYEGYLSLSKIITESNAYSQRTGIEGKAVTTFENLRKNVAKGHIVCTSACIAGPFGLNLGCERKGIQEKIDKYAKKLAAYDYFNATALKEKYDALMKIASKDLTKTKESAEKAMEKNGGKLCKQMVKYYELKREQDSAIADLEENAEQYEEALTKYASIKALRLKSTATLMEKQTELLAALPSQEESLEKCKAVFADLIDIFGKDDFYFELQNHGIPEEKEIYSALVAFAKSMGHERYIASNDVHIGVTGDDRNELENAVIARNIIQSTRFNSISEEGISKNGSIAGKYNPPQPDDYEYYIKDDDKLRAALSEIFPEDIVNSAIGNIEHALSDCHVEFPKNQKFYPKFCEDENGEFDRLIAKGIKQRFPDGFPSDEYQKRLDYETGIIKKMGYVGYHLIVQDYLQYTRLLGYLPDNEIATAPLSIPELEKIIEERGIEKIGYNIGPGRGSAGGSLVCFVLGITDIDPMPHELLFERFLNPERVSMPDIDADFRTDLRQKSVEYCAKKYGEDCVCQIMTKAYGAGKGNIRLAGRYLAYKDYYDSVESKLLIDEENSEEVSAQAKKISAIKKAEEEKIKKYWASLADDLAKSMTTDMATIDDLIAYVEEHPVRVSNKDIENTTLLLSYAKNLDGVFTNYGQHAAGTIISSKTISDVMPLMYNDSKCSMETQCTMAQAESKGMLKMDFLGLNNLDIYTRIMRATNDNVIQEIKKRPYLAKDKYTFEIFCKGLTHGVFQFESDGMKKMLLDFQPDNLEDIILLVAAYRPGPMDFIPEIIANKKYRDGRSSERPVQKLTDIIDRCKTLRDILTPTYNCIIYQEQVMEIFQKLAGYSLGQADLVRRAMSKKHLDELVAERKAFTYGDEARGIQGCIQKVGITKEDCALLFDVMEAFAKYAFNKSHAAAYAYMAVFGAYLKRYHPAEFYAENLNAIKKQDEILPFVKEMRRFGVRLLPPDIREQNNEFKANGKNIIYGLGFIKGSASETVKEGDEIKCACTKDYSGDDSTLFFSDIVDFINANSNIALKDIERFILTGCFDKEYPNRKALATWFADNRENFRKDADNTIVPLWKYKSIQPDIMFNRMQEQSLLGVSFSIQDSLDLIRNTENHGSFRELHGDKDWVSAVVLNCTGPHKTKKGTTYYRITLEDAYGEIIERRFDAPVTVLEGRFKVYTEEHKYYLSNTAQDCHSITRRNYVVNPQYKAEYARLQKQNGDVIARLHGQSGAVSTTTQEIAKAEAEHDDFGFYDDFGRGR